MLILGIDDSGRGPVIGPMVLAGCLIDATIEPELKKLGVKDSKQLTPEKRVELVIKIKEKARAFHVEMATAFEIDEKTKCGVNLNKLEAIKAAAIINALNKKNAETKVIIDCPSPNIKAWKNTLLSYIEKKDNLDISCEHKADVNHVACSAASIIAKTTRDAEIEKIKKIIGIDFGSGYATDPITQDFLDKHFYTFNKKGIFRESWQTWKDKKAEKAQKALDDF